MAKFIDVENNNGEIQTVPEHYLESFPDQFKKVSAAKPSTPAKADTKKES